MIVFVVWVQSALVDAFPMVVANHLTMIRQIAWAWHIVMAPNISLSVVVGLCNECMICPILPRYHFNVKHTYLCLNILFKL